MQLGVALWTDIIFRSAAVSRFVLSRKPAPQWPTRGTQMVVPGGRIGALESPQTLFLGLKTRKSLVSSFSVFLTFLFTQKSTITTLAPSAWLMVMAWRRLLAALPPRAGKELGPVARTQWLVFI